MYKRKNYRAVINPGSRVLPVLALFLCLTALPGNEMPVPRQSDLPGAEIKREELFIGGALWGLINGAADLYYEYGFDRMILQEISWQGEEFRLELYRMTSPLSALGIFSVSVHGCIKGGPATTGDCQGRYQYQLYSANYYLSLINYSGSEKAGELALEIGDIIISLIGEWRVTIPDVFKMGMFAGSDDQVKIIKGKLGLQNVLPDDAFLFEGIHGFIAWYLKHDSGNGKNEIMLIEKGSEWEGEFPGIIRERFNNAGYSTSLLEGSLLAVRSETMPDTYQCCRGKPCDPDISIVPRPEIICRENNNLVLRCPAK